MSLFEMNRPLTLESPSNYRIWLINTTVFAQTDWKVSADMLPSHTKKRPKRGVLVILEASCD